MSATRRASRESRAASLSPYARPAPKSCAWSLTRFLRSLNPLRFHSSKDEERLSSDEESESDSDNEEHEEETLPSPTQSLPREEQQVTQNVSTNDQAFPSTTQSLSRTEQQLTQNVATNDQAFPSPTQSLSRTEQQLTQNVFTNGQILPFPPPTYKRPRSIQMQDSAPRTGLPHVEFTFRRSAISNLDIVSNFLVHYGNQPMRVEDIHQMVALLQHSKPDGKILSFESLGTTSLSHSESPDFSLSSSTSATPRTLPKNPNGSYKWKGAGKSRAHRTRNTYSSPAITIHRSTLPRTATTEAEALGHDRKRRKLSDSAAEPRDSQVVNGASSNPVPLPVASTSTDSSSRTITMTPLKSTSTATPVRQRTQALQRPTAPVVPSPLRQAWTGGSPSGSESGLLQGSTPVRRTKTAQHVTDFVKSLNSQETVLAELRNPYEVANPVKRPTMPKRRRVVAFPKTFATTNPAPKETTTKVAKEMSAHAIIEATLPKGSKRSRPSNLEKATTQDEEALEDVTEEEIPLPKRFKPLTNGRKESEDTLCQAAKEAREKPIVVHSNAIGTHVPIKPVIGPKSSMPKEPSKLRFSVQPESTSTPTSPTSESNAELEASKLAVQPPKVTIIAPTLSQDKRVASTTDEVPASTRVTSNIAVPTRKSAKDNARSQPLTSLPLFTFTFPFFSSGNVKVKDVAKATPVASLPTYDLACSGVAIEASKPATSFNWAAAGLKKPSASLGGGWTCGECFLSNPATATTKCTTCEAPKPGAMPKSNGIV